MAQTNLPHRLGLPVYLMGDDGEIARRIAFLKGVAVTLALDSGAESFTLCVGDNSVKVNPWMLKRVDQTGRTSSVRAVVIDKMQRKILRRFPGYHRISTLEED